MQAVKSSGIYHGIPSFPDDQKKYSILIAGANGITGSYLVSLLNASPERWVAVYALSRKPPAHTLGGNVKYLSIDLLSPPERIAEQLEETGPMSVAFPS
jgi:hypothetical protein